MVARAGDRLHPRPHARPAAPRGSARGSLPDLAGAGIVVCAGPARAATAALGRRARIWLPLRHQGVPRPCAGGRRRTAARVTGEHRAMDRHCAVVLVAACCAAAPGTALAQRQPVLKQVGVPHAYYWREMYVPQVTSGPSAVTWSPDGTELIYSMQGWLWRQRIGSRVAQQLTAGEGYDYQPDWAPAGRLAVFAPDADHAMQLQLLDLAAKTVRPVTADGAVNVEPRWSPDGTRIAFVSSAYNRRWHIFTIAMTAGTPAGATVTTLTDDNASRLPRYSYSVCDQYISPTC